MSDIALQAKMKACKRCGEVKTINMFFGKRQTIDGHSGTCKSCDSAASKRLYLTKRDDYIRQHRAYYSGNRRKFSEYNRESNLRRFGLTVSKYEAMLEEQGGVCALCLGVNADGRRLAVDHCHSTGRVRGLLCGECNQSLGKLKDSPSLLRKAAIYIENGGNPK